MRTIRRLATCAATTVLAIATLFACGGAKEDAKTASSRPSAASSGTSPASPVSGSKATAASPAPADAPLASLPYTPALDVTAMDRSADPCVDFYQYSCGGWIKQNPTPPDQAVWSVYAKLSDENRRLLWGILEADARPSPDRSPAQQKIGDYYAACTDTAAINARGAAPLRSALDAVAALASVRDLAPLVARLQREGYARYEPHVLFGFAAEPDLDDASRVIAWIGAGGLGMPDRDYYTKSDAQTLALRQKYVAHVARMLALLGDDPDTAAREAATVLRIETDLAGAALTRVELRDPHKLANRTTRAKLIELAPAFDWAAYFAAAGAPDVAVLNVTEPAFLKALSGELAAVPLSDWKTYLRWHLLHAKARYLSSRFEEEDFDFYSHTLRGVPQMRPRWKRCVGWIDQQLGEALGEEFVKRTFTDGTRDGARAMTAELERAMEGDLTALTWMGPATRKEALAKLHGIANKIGYPEHFRDYGPVAILRDDFAGDVERALSFEARRQLAKIGKPVDRSEWSMTPPTVDAYYDAQRNDINFPAGVLQPPLYDARLDLAPSYGNTGSTIGHELTHGFDDEGRQFDARGNLRDWWSKDDAKAFEARAQCVVDQYAEYTIVDDIKINSKLTEGEDVADLGGTILAYAAWKHAVAGQTLANADGFTPDQRFFIGFAQWTCETERPENLRVNAVVNPHSPGVYRVNGVVSNMQEFQDAFACKAGQAMVRAEKCRVW